METQEEIFNMLADIAFLHDDCGNFAAANAINEVAFDVKNLDASRDPIYAALLGLVVAQIPDDVARPIMRDIIEQFG